MRTSPLPADFIHARACKPICEKYLTLPSASNMIFNNNRLFGVIDFGDFIVSDPDNDFLCLLDCSTDDFGKDFGRRVLRYYQHKNPEVAERKAELNDAYWAIDQIIYGYERSDRNMLTKGISELLRTQAKSFIF